MDRRFLTVLGVSLVFALVVSAIFYQLTARAGAPNAKVPESKDMKDVVVMLMRVDDRPLIVLVAFVQSIGKVDLALFVIGAIGEAGDQALIELDRAIVGFGIERALGFRVQGVSRQRFGGVQAHIA